MTINTGWTPYVTKRCSRCGKPHTDQLYFLCEACRMIDWLAAQRKKAAEWNAKFFDDAADEHDRQSEAHLTRYGF